MLTLAAIAVIAGARVAEPFLVPVVTGILLSYTLRPLVAALERLHIARVIGAALVIVVLAGLLSAVGYVIRDDVNAAVAELPAAARKLRLAAADAARQPESPMTHMKAAAIELDRAAAEADRQTYCRRQSHRRTTWRDSCRPSLPSSRPRRSSCWAKC